MTSKSPLNILTKIGVLLIVLAGSVLADEGGLSTDAIKDLRSFYEVDQHTRAIYNALTNTDIKKLAVNRDLLLQHNDMYSHKIKTKGVTNQKSSGRCWLFAGLNVLRPIVIQKYKLDEFEFSQNYLTFWDKLEKSNTFLEYIIEFREREPMDREMEMILDNPVGDGGFWKNCVALIEKYGLVPQVVMPESNSSEKTGDMNRILKRQLRVDAIRLRNMHTAGNAVEELRAEKEEMLAVTYQILAVNLGEPPEEFEYRYKDSDSTVTEPKKYTPQSFYDEFVGVDLDDWVNLYHNPMREYGKHYEIKLTRNMYDHTDIDYANCKIELMKELATKSVLNDDPVVFGCDVGKDQNSDHGIMAMDIYDYCSIYGTDMEMSKADRGWYRESAANHMMVFIGVDVKDGQPVKWLVENSWGDKKGDDGLFGLYDTWFDNHVYNVLLKKEYVPKEILEVYQQEIITLPAWDPMSKMFR